MRKRVHLDADDAEVKAATRRGTGRRNNNVIAIPFTTKIIIINDGDVHETAKIEIKVKNFLNGVQLYPTEDQGEYTEEILMPETERSITQEVGGISALGMYEVTQSVEELQEQADEFCHFYIYERWHMGLPNMMTPSEFKDFYNRDPECAKLALTTLRAKRYGKRKILICD